jgi:hypothetical protein
MRIAGARVHLLQSDRGPESDLRPFFYAPEPLEA